MKKILYLIICAALLFSSSRAFAASPIIRNYGDLLEQGSYWMDNAGQAWNLTSCDLTISYTLDLSRHFPDGQLTEWTMVGIGSGAWAWMSSGSPAASTTDPNLKDIDDKLHLGSMPNKGDESNYDVVFPNRILESPIGVPWNNYGFWFDRDGIGDSQEKLWGEIDGATYNTGGIYDVILQYHAISPQLGVVFASVNGVQSGIYHEWRNTRPDYFPVGISFSGDLSNIKIFASLWGEGVQLTDFQAEGCSALP